MKSDYKAVMHLYFLKRFIIQIFEQLSNKFPDWLSKRCWKQVVSQ